MPRPATCSTVLPTAFLCSFIFGRAVPRLLPGLTGTAGQAVHDRGTYPTWPGGPPDSNTVYQDQEVWLARFDGLRLHLPALRAVPRAGPVAAGPGAGRGPRSDHLYLHFSHWIARRRLVVGVVGRVLPVTAHPLTAAGCVAGGGARARQHRPSFEGGGRTRAFCWIACMLGVLLGVIYSKTLVGAPGNTSVCSHFVKKLDGGRQMVVVVECQVGVATSSFRVRR